ncbi:MAG: S8 family serine peptidase [Actinobacteria bacterium]|nr:S8 family serine peptidase [Actinomycetota bacterium]
MKKLVESGAKVINGSFGPEKPDASNAWQSTAYRKFLEKMAKDHPDVIFVAAAGNEDGGLDGSNYSIGGHKLPNLITVGALKNDGKKADFSNYATGDGEISISAPGVDMVLGVGPDGKAVKASGTSFASPQVAAAAALIKSIDPDITASEIKEILQKTAARAVPSGNQTIRIPANMGGGVLRVDAAVLEAINRVREKQGLKRLEKADLLGMGKISLSAEGGPTDFKVTVSLKTVGDEGTEVKVELQGEGAIGGDLTKTLESPGSLTWDVTRIQDRPCTIKATRLDTGAWAYVDLAVVPVSQTPRNIFNSGNVMAVKNGPEASTSFTLKKKMHIVSITNYHWNDGKGASPGTIGLVGPDGTEYGPWASYGIIGQGGAQNVSWVVEPNIDLEPGRYRIRDSGHGTWSWNEESGGRGFSVVSAYEVVEEEPGED